MILSPLPASPAETSSSRCRLALPASATSQLPVFGSSSGRLAPSAGVDNQPRRLSKLFQATTFDECPVGHVTMVKPVTKRFSLLKLFWRHVNDPQQFILRQDLFDAVKMSPDAQCHRGGNLRIARAQAKSPVRTLVPPSSKKKLSWLGQ